MWINKWMCHNSSYWFGDWENLLFYGYGCCGAACDVEIDILLVVIFRNSWGFLRRKLEGPENACVGENH
ncbi:MAG: hypothetical protein IPF52_14330 [Saprospiraceae bacterium]|nr:hypothetical protein [Saprospiraceae bacterium]